MQKVHFAGMQSHAVKGVKLEKGTTSVVKVVLVNDKKGQVQMELQIVTGETTMSFRELVAGHAGRREQGEKYLKQVKLLFESTEQWQSMAAIEQTFKEWDERAASGGLGGEETEQWKKLHAIQRKSWKNKKPARDAKKKE